MSFKYSVVCDTLSFLGHDFLAEPGEILRAIKDAGYEGADLPGDPRRMDSETLRPTVEAAGLKVPALLGAWAPFHGGEVRDMAGENEEARARGIAYARESIDLCRAMGARFFQVCAVQPPAYDFGFPRTPIRTLRENFLRAVEEIAAYAARREVTILLEPVNGYEAYPGVLTSVYEAKGIIDELGLDNLGIQPDVYHMNISEGPMLKALRDVGPYIRHVHVNETNHYSLGSGHADFPGIVRVLRDVGYEGYLAIYMPLTTQENFYAERGYTHSDPPVALSDTAKSDLRPYLETPIAYLRQIKKTLEAATRIY